MVEYNKTLGGILEYKLVVSSFNGESITDYVFGDGVLKVMHNGDIFYKGRLLANDKEVLEGLRKVLAGK